MAPKRLLTKRVTQTRKKKGRGIIIGEKCIGLQRAKFISQLG